ncbi:hypothetical protein LPTSP4_24810 [Leptospira ryugenii]|uniref:Uncharacterized protein n=1 Tax=Leptospira ryugenii TaxID=1917863 RepID=A0A2P2E258_9LEPT|nr:hypothetical protein LPTSP4_24810 [Leptospira ryugenii]
MDLSREFNDDRPNFIGLEKTPTRARGKLQIPAICHHVGYAQDSSGNAEEECEKKKDLVSFHVESLGNVSKKHSQL